MNDRCCSTAIVCNGRVYENPHRDVEGDGSIEQDAEQYIHHLEKALPKYGIADSRLRLAHFFAQVLHESGCMRFDMENLNYSSEALPKVFGKYFTTKAEADAYARQPEKIANRVYANRMGNRGETSGDGWKYRGRGLIQLTGRNNYKAFAEWLGDETVVDQPDLVRASTPCSPPYSSGTRTT